MLNFQELRKHCSSNCPESFNSTCVPFNVVFIELQILKIRCVNYAHFPTIMQSMCIAIIYAAMHVYTPTNCTYIVRYGYFKLQKSLDYPAFDYLNTWLSEQIQVK